MLGLWTSVLGLNGSSSQYSRSSSLIHERSSGLVDAPVVVPLTIHCSVSTTLPLLRRTAL